MIILNFSKRSADIKAYMTGDVVYINDSNLPLGMLSIGDFRIMTCLY